MFQNQNALKSHILRNLASTIGSMNSPLSYPLSSVPGSDCSIALMGALPVFMIQIKYLQIYFFISPTLITLKKNIMHCSVSYYFYLGYPGNFLYHYFESILIFPSCIVFPLLSTPWFINQHPKHDHVSCFQSFQLFSSEILSGTLILTRMLWLEKVVGEANTLFSTPITSPETKGSGKHSSKTMI